nr:hypothetical protein B0A51_10295 [Rachicladosporium sp. CCFEE 5018]
MSAPAAELQIHMPPTLPDLQHPVERHTSSDGKIDIIALPSQNRTADRTSTPYPFPDAPPPPKDLTVAVADPTVDGLTHPADIEAYSAEPDPSKPISTSHKLASNTFPACSPPVKREKYNCTPVPTNVAAVEKARVRDSITITPEGALRQLSISSSTPSTPSKDKPLPPLPDEPRTDHASIGHVPSIAGFLSTVSVVSTMLADEFGDGGHGRVRANSFGVQTLGHGPVLSECN